MRQRNRMRVSRDHAPPPCWEVNRVIRLTYNACGKGSEVLRQPENHGSEIDVVVRDVACYRSTRIQDLEVERHAFACHEMKRYCVSVKGIDNEHIEQWPRQVGHLVAQELPRIAGPCRYLRPPRLCIFDVTKIKYLIPSAAPYSAMRTIAALISEKSTASPGSA